MKSKKQGITNLRFAGGLLVNQFLAVVISFIITGILNTILRNSAFLSNILSLYFFLLLCYIEGWNQGFYDNNQIKLGYQKNNLFRGVYAGFIAALPGLIIAALAFAVIQLHLNIYSIMGQDISIFLYRFWYMPVQIIYPNLYNIPVLHFIPPLIMPVTCGFGYILGLRQFALRQILVYEREADKGGTK